MFGGNQGKRKDRSSNEYKTFTVGPADRFQNLFRDALECSSRVKTHGFTSNFPNRKIFWVVISMDRPSSKMPGHKLLGHWNMVFWAKITQKCPILPYINISRTVGRISFVDPSS